MNKRLFASLVCAGLLLSCPGCQLADPEQSEQAAEQDRLIGVFATEEYLDLFDFDAYFSDNAEELASGGEAVISSRDSAAYGGRIWAVQKDNGDWVFEGLEGLGLYAYRYESSAESGTATHLDEGLTGNGMHVTSTDEGESVELEATIYHVPGSRVRYHFNPVYQTPDGAVYLAAGTGIDLEGAAEGESSTYTLSDSVTATGPDGQSTVTSFSAAVHVEIMSAPEKITILQMDADSGVLDRTGYDPGRTPESLTLEEGCAYLIVETRKSGPEGETVARELADAGAESFSTFCVRPDGVCVKRETALVSPGADKEADA